MVGAAYFRHVKRVLLSFLLGLAAGWGAYWYVDHHKFQAWRTKQKVMHQVEAAAHSLEERFSEITTQAVKEQLAKTGVYIVEKAKEAGAVVANATTDARITATIKTKLFGEPGMPAMRINVDTSDGVVTLSGTANSLAQVTTAIQLAAATGGVRRVISTIQVKPDNSGQSPPTQ